MATQPQDNAPRQSDAASASSDETMDAFDAAMVEIEADDTGAPADDAAAQDGNDGSDFNSADQDATPAKADPAPAADNTAPANNPSPANNPTDIWANAPAELREAHNRDVRDLELKYRSAASRQAALQKQLAEKVQQQGGDAQDQAKAEDAADKGGAGNLAELREDFPDFAPLIDQIETLMKGKADTERVVQTVQQREADAFIAEQEGILSKAHPDWMDAAADERFTGWLESQPTAIQEAFKRNYAAVVDGNDAALVIGRFKADMGVDNFGAAQEQSQPDPQQQRRERQLKANRDTRRPGGPATTQGFDTEDFDAVVNALADKM
jgi:hypothetical protein